MRQFVFVLGQDGFNLYDLTEGNATVSHHPVAQGGPPPPGTPRRA